MKGTLDAKAAQLITWRERLRAAERLHDGRIVECFKEEFASAVRLLVEARIHRHAGHCDGAALARPTEKLTATLKTYHSSVEAQLDEAVCIERFMDILQQSITDAEGFIKQDWERKIGPDADFADLKCSNTKIHAEKALLSERARQMEALRRAIASLEQGYAQKSCALYSKKYENFADTLQRLNSQLSIMLSRCVAGESAATAAARKAITVDRVSLSRRVRRNIAAGALEGVQPTLTDSAFYCKLSLPPNTIRQAAVATAFSVASQWDIEGEGSEDDFWMQYFSKLGYDTTAHVGEAAAARVLDDLRCVLAEMAPVGLIVQVVDAEVRISDNENRTGRWATMRYGGEVVSEVAVPKDQCEDVTKARLLSKVILQKTTFLRRVRGSREGFLHELEVSQLNGRFRCQILGGGARPLLVRCQDLEHVVRRHCGHPNLKTSMGRLHGARDSVQQLNSFFEYLPTANSPDESITTHISNLWTSLETSPEASSCIAVCQTHFGVDCSGNRSNRAVVITDCNLQRDPCTCGHPVTETQPNLQRLKTCYPVQPSFGL